MCMRLPQPGEQNFHFLYLFGWNLFLQTQIWLLRLIFQLANNNQTTFFFKKKNNNNNLPLSLLNCYKNTLNIAFLLFITFSFMEDNVSFFFIYDKLTLKHSYTSEFKASQAFSYSYNQWVVIENGVKISWDAEVELTSFTH